MKCNNCGHEMDLGAVKCKMCGHSAFDQKKENTSSKAKPISFDYTKAYELGLHEKPIKEFKGPKQIDIKFIGALAVFIILIIILIIVIITL